MQAEHEKSLRRAFKCLPDERGNKPALPSEAVSVMLEAEAALQNSSCMAGFDSRQIAILASVARHLVLIHKRLEALEPKAQPAPVPEEPAKPKAQPSMPAPKK